MGRKELREWIEENSEVIQYHVINKAKMELRKFNHTPTLFFVLDFDDQGFEVFVPLPNGTALMHEMLEALSEGWSRQTLFSKEFVASGYDTFASEN